MIDIKYFLAKLGETDLDTKKIDAIKSYLIEANREHYTKGWILNNGNPKYSSTIEIDVIYNDGSYGYGLGNYFNFEIPKDLSVKYVVWYRKV